MGTRQAQIDATVKFVTTAGLPDSHSPRIAEWHDCQLLCCQLCALSSRLGCWSWSDLTPTEATQR